MVTGEPPSQRVLLLPAADWYHRVAGCGKRVVFPLIICIPVWNQEKAFKCVVKQLSEGLLLYPVTIYEVLLTFLTSLSDVLHGAKFYIVVTNVCDVYNLFLPWIWLKLQVGYLHHFNGSSKRALLLRDVTVFFSAELHPRVCVLELSV